MVAEGLLAQVCPAGYWLDAACTQVLFGPCSILNIFKKLVANI